MHPASSASVGMPSAMFQVNARRRAIARFSSRLAAPSGRQRILPTSSERPPTPFAGRAWTRCSRSAGLGDEAAEGSASVPGPGPPPPRSVVMERAPAARAASSCGTSPDGRSTSGLRRRRSACRGRPRGGGAQCARGASRSTASRERAVLPPVVPRDRRGRGRAERAHHRSAEAGLHAEEPATARARDLHATRRRFGERDANARALAERGEADPATVHLERPPARARGGRVYDVKRRHAVHRGSWHEWWRGGDRTPALRGLGPLLCRLSYPPTRSPRHLPRELVAHAHIFEPAVDVGARVRELDEERADGEQVPAVEHADEVADRRVAAAVPDVEPDLEHQRLAVREVAALRLEEPARLFRRTGRGPEVAEVHAREERADRLALLSFALPAHASLPPTPRAPSLPLAASVVAAIVAPLHGSRRPRAATDRVLADANDTLQPKTARAHAAQEGQLPAITEERQERDDHRAAVRRRGGHGRARARGSASPAGPTGKPRQGVHRRALASQAGRRTGPSR